MAELSSLLFVDTDELGRPTGLIASEENDTFASALMPQDVKDTVFVVADADVSNNYPAWNTVSSVSGLGEISGVLEALPGQFENLEASVADISTVVETFDPTVIESVSASVFNTSSDWNQAYTYIDDASGDIRDTSNAVIGADSGLSTLALSSLQLSTAIDNIPIGGQVPTDVSSKWQESYIYSFNASDNLADTSNAVIGAESGLSSLETSTASLSSTFAASAASLSTAIENVPTGGSIPTDVSAPWQNTFVYTNGASGDIGNTSAYVGGASATVTNVSGLVFDGSSVLSSLSGVMPGIRSGPDVSMASALSAIANRVRLIDGVSGVDGGNNNTIQLFGTARIQSQGTMVFTKVNSNGDELSQLKLESTLCYLSSNKVGLVALDDILIGRTGPETVTGGSSIYNLYSDVTETSGNWDSSYEYVGGASGNIGNVSAFVGGASGNIGNTSAYVGGASGNIGNVSAFVGGASGNIGNTSAYVGGASGNIGNTSAFVGGASGNIGNVSAYVGGASGNIGNTSAFVGGASATIIDVSTIVEDGSGVLADISGVDKQLSATTLTILGKTNINIGPTACNTSSLIPIIADLASVSGTGGGGGGVGDASAIIVGAGDFDEIDVTTTATPGQYLIYNANNTFTYTDSPLIQIQGEPLGTYGPGSEGATFDFGASAGTKVEFASTSGTFTTSGPTKTLLEFEGLSRVGLGFNSVPLEISALGESNVRLRSDNTNGAFVLVEGTDAAPSLVHLKNTDLSADADSQIDFDTDINLGAAAHLDGNMLGAIHIACKNTQGTSVSGGTPVYIKGNVGGSNKIEIGVASASVASSMPAVGILSEDLANNAEGYVDAFGIASKLDTSLFTSGDTLYVAPSGGLTNVRPTVTTDLVQNIGIVELSDASNGKIIVLGPGRTNDVPTSVNNEVTFASAITINNTLTANGGTGSTHPTAGGQVLQSRGASTSVTWGNKKKLRWYESDFHSADVRINGPWLGAAINSGTTGGGPAVALYAEMMGAVLLRSSTTANSGYRWDTQAFDRIAPRKNLFFECIFAIPDDFTNKTAKLGFYDDATNTTAGVDGTYFLIDNSGNMTPETSNNSTRTTGTSYSLSVDTVYKAQIWWNGSSSVVFKITNMDESTVHASEVINTNVPSGTTRRFGAGLVTESSGTATDDLLVLDYMGWGLYPYREDDSL